MRFLNGETPQRPVCGDTVADQQGVRYTVVEAVCDRYGILVAARRPRGRTVYLMRYHGSDQQASRIASLNV